MLRRVMSLTDEGRLEALRNGDFQPRDGDVRGFLHVCCTGAYREVTREIVHTLLESRLYDRSAVIEVGVLGSAADQQFVEDLLRPFDRFRIAFRSTDLTEYEFPTLGLLQDACRTWDGPVYYLHTKGVSYSPHNQFSRYWRRLMLDEIVTNHERCLAALRDFDTAGTNWSEGGFYSGNFWWARASHIRTLPEIRELQRNPVAITRDVHIDGSPVSQRGVGPIWNQRLQCEFWLHMVPGRAAKMGMSRPNLYRELLWTTSIDDIVNDLLDASPARGVAEVTDEDATPPPGDGYDVILIDVRDDPQHVPALIEGCLPKLAADGAVVVRHTNPPSAWHQRPAPTTPGADWTGQVWRAVVEFRIRHPECEVFTVDTHWGCTVIRPGRPARRRLDIDSANRLDWRALVEQRGHLLNLVDVSWFRRNLYATPYLSGTVKPSSTAEVANLLIAAEGLNSYLRIGPADEVLDRIIAPVRHSVHTIEGVEALGLTRYDLIVVDGPDLQRALTLLSDDGLILTRGPLPQHLPAEEFDTSTCAWNDDYTLIRRRPADDAASAGQRPATDAFGAPRLVVEPYEGNVETLRAAIELDPDDLRSVLFLGDAYYEAGEFDAARTWYSHAAELREWWWNGLDTGVYVALLRVAELMERAGEPWPTVRDAYLRAWEIRPDRPAPLHAIALRYRLDARYELACLYAKAALDMPCPDPAPAPLPNEPEAWRVRDELALCALRMGKPAEAYALWRQLLSRTDLPPEDRERIAGNCDECVPDEPLAARQTMVTVIGRGNSGTRAIANTLMRSGVFMGAPIKQDSADLVPPEDMYEACRIIARYIPWRGGLQWDFGPVQTMPIPAEFTQLVERYLSSVLNSPAPRVGWKLPETTLCYPWIKRMFPDIKYIFWVRNPRDCITNVHLTDDLRDFGIQYPPTDDPYLRRAISWKYQDDLVAATGRPQHWISVRLEDFITHQDRELARLEEFLGFPMARIPVKTDPIDRHKRMPDVPFPEFLAPAMRDHRYDT